MHLYLLCTHVPDLTQGYRVPKAGTSLFMLCSPRSVLHIALLRGPLVPAEGPGAARRGATAAVGPGAVHRGARGGSRLHRLGPPPPPPWGTGPSAVGPAGGGRGRYIGLTALNIGSLCHEYRISMPRISDLCALNIGSTCLEYRISMPRISDLCLICASERQYSTHVFAEKSQAQQKMKSLFRKCLLNVKTDPDPIQYTKSGKCTIKTKNRN